jgi:hypothetical protein
MNAILLEILLASSLAGTPWQSSACWQNKGQRELYGSYEQVIDLQNSVKATKCALLALSWRIVMPGGGTRRSFLLWDSAAQTLARVHIESGGPQGRDVYWDKWTGATREQILADDPSDGFDLGRYSTGRGRVVLSSKQRAFVRRNAGNRFDVAM